MTERPISAVIEQCIRNGTPIEYDPSGGAIMVMGGPHRGRGIDVDAMLAAYRAEVERLRSALDPHVKSMRDANFDRSTGRLLTDRPWPRDYKTHSEYVRAFALWVERGQRNAP